jgi:hypothetical protein
VQAGGIRSVREGEPGRGGRIEALKPADIREGG